MFYQSHVEALTGSTKDAKDPDAVARACYFAAVVYTAFIVFCGSQVSRLHYLRHVGELMGLDDGP
jgi:ribonuclease kappa